MYYGSSIWTNRESTKDRKFSLARQDEKSVVNKDQDNFVKEILLFERCAKSWGSYFDKIYLIFWR